MSVLELTVIPPKVYLPTDPRGRAEYARVAVEDETGFIGFTSEQEYLKCTLPVEIKGAEPLRELTRDEVLDLMVGEPFYVADATDFQAFHCDNEPQKELLDRGDD